MTENSGEDTEYTSLTPEFWDELRADLVTCPRRGKNKVLPTDLMIVPLCGSFSRAPRVGPRARQADLYQLP